MTKNNYDDDGMLNLARSIMFEAVKDRKRAIQRNSKRRLEETEKFFKSSWYETIAGYISLDISGIQALKLIDERLKEKQHA